MKKKFLSGLMALAIAIPCAFGLVGCGDDPADPPAHTHAYETCDEYVVADSKAYYATKKCSCGDYEKTELTMVLSGQNSSVYRGLTVLQSFPVGSGGSCLQ